MAIFEAAAKVRKHVEERAAQQPCVVNFTADYTVDYKTGEVLKTTREHPGCFQFHVVYRNGNIEISEF